MMIWPTFFHRADEDPEPECSSEVVGGSRRPMGIPPPAARLTPAQVPAPAPSPPAVARTLPAGNGRPSRPTPPAAAPPPAARQQQPQPKGELVIEDLGDEDFESESGGATAALSSTFGRGARSAAPAPQVGRCNGRAVLAGVLYEPEGRDETTEFLGPLYPIRSLLAALQPVW